MEYLNCRASFAICSAGTMRSSSPNLLGEYGTRNICSEILRKPGSSTVVLHRTRLEKFYPAFFKFHIIATRLLIPVESAEVKSSDEHVRPGEIFWFLLILKIYIILTTHENIVSPQ